MSLEVDSGDVIRLVLQFLKENNLNRTLSVLQEESQISLNTVESAEAFQQDILRGNWDAVLQACATLKLSMSSLFELYEHIVMEMMELREVDTARAIMRMTTTMNLMKQEQPERYLALEHMLTRSQFDPTDLFPEGKEKKREKIAQTILSEVSVVPPSRLLSIINQALKWQRYQGLIQPGSSFDVFRGVIPDRLQHEEKPPTQVAHTVKFGKKSHAECASFSPDGHFLVSGSVDGFLEVWDPMTGKLRKDLDYQNASDDLDTFFFQIANIPPDGHFLSIYEYQVHFRDCSPRKILLSFIFHPLIREYVWSLCLFRFPHQFSLSMMTHQQKTRAII
eukprot:TRINITY_DN3081_c0_g2_i2.p1 TRINITY_DN3081_c0_g2~~TRINITY_DN3081_c0_g2_i2.p1  ORF type:complete len:335 (+),score=67.04 TRINITY_DN3081_c0_g2_i2:69-1073(+)